MHRATRLLILFVLCVCLGKTAFAQAIPMASRTIIPSVFAGVSSVYTGLDSGRNLSVAAGLDIAFFPRARFEPALEYRAMYALDKGSVDSLKNNLGGIKLSTRYGHMVPYADLLAGRGETTYANGGYQVPQKLIFYTLSSSNVYSLGGGTDLQLAGHLMLKVDVQIQRYSSPVTVSGHLYSEVGTIGLVYMFHLRRTIL